MWKSTTSARFKAMNVHAWPWIPARSKNVHNGFISTLVKCVNHLIKCKLFSQVRVNQVGCVQLNWVHFGKPLAMNQLSLVVIAYSQHDLLKQKREREIVKDWLQNNKLKNYTQFKYTSDCSNAPYHLLSTTISSNDLLDSNFAVQLDLYEPF